MWNNRDKVLRGKSGACLEILSMSLARKWDHWEVLLTKQENVTEGEELEGTQ